MFSSFVNFEFRELDAGGLLVQDKNDRWNKVLLCPLWHSERLPRFFRSQSGLSFCRFWFILGDNCFSCGSLNLKYRWSLSSAAHGY